MDKEFINNRFIDCINYLTSTNKELNKKKIANTLGISTSKFSEILNRRMNVSPEIIANISTYYRINCEWLLTGEGTMIRMNNTTNNLYTIEEDPSLVNEENGTYGGNYLNDPENIRFLQHTIGRLQTQIDRMQSLIEKLQSENEKLRNRLKELNSNESI